MNKKGQAGIGKVLTIVLVVLTILVLLIAFVPSFNKLFTGILGISGFHESFSQNPSERANQMFDDLADFLESLEWRETDQLCIAGRYLRLPEQYKERYFYQLSLRGEDYYLEMREQDEQNFGQSTIVVVNGKLKEKKLKLNYRLHPMKFDPNQNKFTFYDSPFPGVRVVFWYDQFVVKENNDYVYDNEPFAYGPYLGSDGGRYYLTNKYPTFYLHPDYDNWVLLDPPGPAYTPSEDTVPINGVQECG